MEHEKQVTVLVFGSLYTYQRERGLPSTLEMSLAPLGKRAIEIAGDLGLPIETIGAIYCNRRPASLLTLIRPGDRVAFIPRSVHGPHNSMKGFPILESGRTFHEVA